MSTPSAAELEAALLVPGDLSGSYGSQPLPGELTDTSLSGCPALGANPAGVREGAAVVLTDPSTGQAVSEALFQMDDAAATKTAMSAFAAAPTTCASFPGLIEGFPFSFTTTALPAVEKLGDQTVAVTLTATATIIGRRITIDEDMIVIRHGDTIIAVITTGDATDALARSAARAAYARVVARW